MSSVKNSRPVQQARIPVWRQLRWNLIAISAIIAIVPALLVGNFILGQARERIVNQLTDQLSSVTTLKNNQLNLWLSQNSDSLNLTSASVTGWLAPQMTDPDFDVSSTGDALGVMLGDIVSVTPGFTNMFVYDLNGRIFATSNEVDLGKVVRRQPYFEASLTGNHLQAPYYQIGNELTMIGTRQIFGADGTAVAILAGTYSLDTLGNIMLERSGLGDTGETYLVSRESNYFLTPSRFEGFDALRAYHSTGIDNALTGQASSGVYPDYRGVPVIGVYQFVPELDAAFLAEIDEQEALADYQNLANIGAAITIAAAGVAVVVALYNSNRVSRPISQLTQSASEFAAGNLKARAVVTDRNEIGLLADTFNTMTDQIQDLVTGLEGRVSARTRDLAATLEVGRLATSLSSREELMPRLVEFIRANFGLYYAQIYLLDEAKRYAILRAGTGETGKELLARNHRLDMAETSLVARAVQSGQAVLVSDTTTSSIHKANELLPETRSEITIPLTTGDDIIGVLDMQAARAGTFNEDNQPVFLAMANQIAAVLNSARAFDEARAATERAEAVNQRLTADNWRPYLGKLGDEGRVGYVYDLEAPVPLKQPLDNVMPEFDESQPLVLRGQKIGKIVVKDDQPREWKDEEKALIRDVSSRLTLALDQFRAFDETQAALSQNEILLRINSALSQALDEQGIIAAVAPYLEQFGIASSSLSYFDNDADGHPEMLNIMAVRTGDGNPLPLEYLPATSVRVQDFPVLEILFAHPDEPVFIEDMFNDRRASESSKAYSKAVGTNASIFLPLRSADQWQGMLSFSWANTAKFNPQLRAIIAALVPSVSAVVASRRAFTETQLALALNETLYAGSDAVNRALTLQDALNAVVEHTPIGSTFRSTLLLFNRAWVDRQPDYTEVVATWESTGEAPLSPYGTRYDVSTYPMISRMRRDQPLLFLDTTTDESLDENARALLVERLGIRSLMLFPLTIGNEWLGFISAQGKEKLELDDDEIRQITALAGQLAVKAQTIRLFEETQRALEVNSRLASISEVLSQALNENEILAGVASYVEQFAVSLSSLSYFELDAKNQPVMLHIQAVRMGDGNLLPLEALPATSVRVQDYPLLDILFAHPNEPVFIEDVDTDPRATDATRAYSQAVSVNASILVPLRTADQWHGMLGFSWPNTYKFDEQLRAIITALVPTLSAVVASQRARVQTQAALQENARRASELQTVAELGTATSTILDSETLLQTVSNLTKERFNLYHAHIYLLDDNGQNLVLAAGAGEPGRIMKAEGRSIALRHPNSLVARAGRTRQGVVANDVRSNPDFLPNPLLPDTRSELATPLIVGDDLLGVLDVQSNEVDRFSDADVQIQTTLAAQIAVAVQNARQFELSEQRLVNLEVSNKIADIIRNSDKDLEGMLEEVLLLATGALGADNAVMTDFNVDDNAWYGLVGVGTGVDTGFVKTIYETADRIPHGVDALRIAQPIPIDDAPNYPNFPQEYIDALSIKSVMTLPILTSSRGRSVVYFNYSTAPHQFSADEVNLARSISGQISVGIERKLAEQQIQLYVDVVSNSPIGFYVWNLEELDDVKSFRLLAANAASYEATGVEPEMIIGKKMVDVFPGLFDTPVPDVYSNVIRTQQPVTLGEVEYSVDGVTPGVFAVRAFPLPGQSCGISFENITERKAQEKEQTLLYEISRGLTNARNAQEALNAVVPYAQMRGAISVSLLYIDSDATGTPIWLESVGVWDADPQRPSVPLGTRFYLPEFPFARLWMRDANNPVFTSDIYTDPNVDAVTRAAMEQSNTFAIAILPLNVQGRWVGIVSMSWGEPMNFNDTDVRIATTISRQMTSVADALRSNEATRAAREQAEMLSAINAALSQSADEREILAAVATYVQPYNFALGSLSYFDSDAKGNPTVLHIRSVRSGDGNEVPLEALPAVSVNVQDYPLLDILFENPFEPVFLEDMFTDERATEASRAYSTAVGVNASIMLPLRTAEVWQGLISFSWTGKQPFAPDMREILTALVPSASAVIASRRAYIESQAAREEVERVYTSSIDMIGSAGFDGYFKTLNPAWSQTLGWTLDELKAEPFVNFVHPDDVESTNAEAAKLSEGATTLSFENRYRRSDGSYRWISWNVSPDTQNALLHFVARDVTANKIAEQEIALRARQLETVAEVGHQIAGNLDVQQLLWSVSNLTRTNFNRYHVQIYLLDNDTETLDLVAGSGEVGEKLVERGHHISLHRENSLVARAARTKRGITIPDVAKESGFMANAMLPETRSEMAIPIMLGTDVIGVLDIQDIRVDAFHGTDLQVKTVLANQIAVAIQNARAFEFQKGVAERLREVDRLKSEFLANMSHELRTPLNSIIGYSEVLLDGIDGDLTEDAVEDVKAIHGSGQHLLNIINDILDLAKIEAGQMRVDRKSVDLSEFVREIGNAAQILVKAKPVELHIIQMNDVPNVHADPIRLRQIVWNLLSNAVKFTEKGSVTVEIGLNDQGMAQVSVTDTGIGMKSDDLPKLFEQFRQVDGSSTRRAGGTGLGLHITRHLVRMHGGDIQVSSTFGQGSTFWFTLPLYVEEAVKS